MWGKKFKNINETKKITTSEGNKEQDHGANYLEVSETEWEWKLTLIVLMWRIG